MIVSFVEKLQQRMQQGLPGMEAQRKMAPAGRIPDAFDETAFPQARKASVLVLFYPYRNAVHTVLMKRPDYDGVHSGQMSFPGGSMEKDDANAAFTALREAEEELGIQKDKVVLTGQLSGVYIPPSNFFVYPFIGYCTERPEFILQKTEVAAIVEVSVDVIVNDTFKGIEKRKRADQIFDAPYYLIGQDKVWGATAIILSELEVILRDII